MKEIRRNQNVIVKRTEYNTIEKRYVTTEITMDHGSFIDVTNAPEYKASIADNSVATPYKLEFVRVADLPGKKASVKTDDGKDVVKSFTIKHTGGGKYNVLDADDNVVNDTPLSKSAAENQIKELTK